MIVRCGLNRLNQFGGSLMTQFKNAREDPKFLSMLKNLDDVLYSGMPISYEDEQWALKNGIRLRVRLPEIFSYLRLVDFSSSRTFLEARKSVECSSPVKTKRTRPYSDHSQIPLTTSFLSNRKNKKGSTHPPLSYTNSSFSQIHRTVQIPVYDTQMATSTPVIYSIKSFRDGTCRVDVMTIGLSQKRACGAIPSPSKTTRVPCATP